jgi:hypothetical protein
MGEKMKIKIVIYTELFGTLEGKWMDASEEDIQKIKAVGENINSIPVFYLSTENQTIFIPHNILENSIFSIEYKK